MYSRLILRRDQQITIAIKHRVTQIKLSSRGMRELARRDEGVVDGMADGILLLQHVGDVVLQLVDEAAAGGSVVADALLFEVFEDEGALVFEVGLHAVCFGGGDGDVDLPVACDDDSVHVISFLRDNET